MCRSCCHAPRWSRPTVRRLRAWGWDDESFIARRHRKEAWVRPGGAPLSTLPVHSLDGRYALRRDQGALLITLVYDPATDDNDQRDPRRLPEDAVVPLEDVAVLLSWALPYDAAPHAKIGFQAIKSGGPIVTRADATTTTSD